MKIPFVRLPNLSEQIDNPLTRGILAGAFTAACIAGTTAFAPVGAVGATGWTVVYTVAGGTAVGDACRRFYKKNKDDK